MGYVALVVVSPAQTAGLAPWTWALPAAGLSLLGIVLLSTASRPRRWALRNPQRLT